MSARPRNPSPSATPGLPDRLREFAEADIADLLEEARAGARARVRTIIEDSLVDELLRAAGRRQAATLPTPDVAGDAWWAYCVLGADQATELATRLAGIEPGNEVEAVLEADLAALVSRVPLSDYGDERLREHLEDLEWLERTARAHEAVLETILPEEAIVPLRLCTIYRDPEGIRKALRENAQVFRDNLSAVEGCAEWGVKVFFDITAVTREPAAVSEARSGTGYLTGLRRERDQAERTRERSLECAEDVHRGVASVARQDRLNSVQRREAHGRDADMVLNGAYLVEGDRVEELEQSLAQLQERWAPEGLLVELTGPWPPYNFVSDSAGLVS